MATGKISMGRCRVRSKRLWRVRWHDGPIVRRRFFSSKAKAAAWTEWLATSSEGLNAAWMAMDQPGRDRLIMAWRVARDRGLDLLSLANTAAESRDDSQGAGLGIGKAIEEMLMAKRQAGRNRRYLASLGQICRQLAKGREAMPLGQFGLAEVEGFLAGKGPAFRPTVRARLSTLFRFAVRRGWRPDNPCDRLEWVRVEKRVPRVLTVKELQTCLDWLRKRPEGLGWFVLSALAGLRPEEAMKTGWKEINFAEGWIRVEAQSSKVRLRRVVYPRGEAMAWLKRAKARRSKLPLTRKRLKRVRRELSRALGWPRWHQDVTRHTAASYWLGGGGAAAQVATALGNSERVLLGHYKAMVTRKEAARFWRAVHHLAAGQ